MKLEKLPFTVDEIVHGAASMGLVSVVVLTTFVTIHLSVTTIRQGIEATLTTLSSRATRSFESLTTKLEPLFTEPDEFERFQLFDKLPYPTHLAAFAPSHKLQRYVLSGVNLDRIQGLSVSFAGVTATEETTRGEPQASGEEYHFKGSSAISAPFEHGVAQVTVRSKQGVVHSFEVTASIDMRSDDDSMGTSTKPGTGTGPRPTPKPTSSEIAALPDPGTQPTQRASDQATVYDDGAHEFADLISSKEFPAIPKELADSLHSQALQSTLDTKSTIQLLDAILEVPGLTPEKQTYWIRKILTARYMVARQVQGRAAALHGHGAGSVELALKHTPRAVVDELDRAGSLNDGLAKLMATAPQGEGPGTPSPGPSATVNPSARKPDESFFQEIYEKERVYQECMAIVQSIAKAYQAYSANAFSPPALDLAELHRKGFLDFVPTCPEQAAGGGYELANKQGPVRCKRHGNRREPWAERKLFDRHFSAYVKAHEMCESDLKGAIEELKGYLKKDGGWEDNNLAARAYLGQLLFDFKDYEGVIEYTQKLSDQMKRDVRLAYIVSRSFYARDNEDAALAYARRALDVPPGEFDRTLDESTTFEKLYELRDKADWIRQHLERKPENKRPRTKYRSFEMLGEPTPPSKICVAHLNLLKALAGRCLKGLRGQQDIHTLVSRIGTADQTINSLAEYQKEERIKAEEERLRLREQLKVVSLDVLAKAGIRNLPLQPPCPAKGITVLDPAGLLQCTAHVGILAANRIEANPSMEDWEYPLLSAVIVYAQRSLTPPLDTCLTRQKQILSHFIDEDTRHLKIAPDVSLDQLVKLGKLPASLVHPDESEGYSITVKNGEGWLECSQHPSLQMLFQQVLLLDQRLGEVK